jgi:hypothetical protein
MEDSVSLRTRWTRLTVPALVLLLLLGPPSLPLQADGVGLRQIDDSFAGQSINTNIWWVGTDQPNAIEITEGGGALTVNISGHAASGFNAGLGTVCRAHGDFDARVSFELAGWPAFDGIYVSLMAFDANNAGFDVYRVSWTWGDSYGAYLPPDGTSVPAGGNRGTLRLVRRGGSATGYYLVGQRWVPIFTGPVAVNDTPVNLSVFNLTDISPFGHDWATIRFTDFHLLAEAISC